MSPHDGADIEGRMVHMAQYMFLLYGSEEWFDTADEQAWRDEIARHTAFEKAVDAAGARILGGEALEPSSTATTVRRGDGTGTPIVSDGPFAETKEALGGYYVIEASDLDQALALASVCPVDTVEVRPVVDTSG